ncbi:alkyl hydroperoxide reductase subunit D [Streptomyces pini]|uniref:Alkyl hydroperoxide reductase AhpD n=2 Tax=Streptomyces pini TaxID=1520580 RepID=A0A1I3VKB6_9ACTN|nr:alkyl hydroperoxide reductase subunit D [Streptomyces pini]
MRDWDDDMALDDLKSALPAYAKDLKLNLGSVIGNSDLPRQQLWGTVLACAIASRSPKVLTELEPEAKANLSPEAYTAAKAAAAVMAMNNVFYRTRHLLSDPEYGTLRAGLRMNVIGNPGVDKTDFELWSLAVSAVNGCGQCLDSHEQVLRKAGVDRETVQEAFKIASVVQAVGTVLDAEATLAGAQADAPAAAAV